MSSLPVFKAMGTGSDTTAVIPTHAAGDYMLLLCESPADDASTPSGWTKIGSYFNSGVVTCLTLFERFATSSSETNPTVSASDHAYVAVYLATGVNPSNPVHNLVTHFTPTRTGLSNAPGLTTNLPNCLILNIFSRHLDNQTGGLSSGETNARIDGGTLVERLDSGTILGNGGGLVLIEGQLAVAATIGPTNVTFSVSVGSAVATLALQSAGENFGIRTQIVNKGDRMPIHTLKDNAQSYDVWMADSTDGSTGKTSLTLAGTLRKYGATSFTSISPTVTEAGTGTYAVDGTTTHFNTYGLCSAKFTATGAYSAELMNFLDVVADNKLLQSPFVGGTAQAGGGSTITLTSGSSATDNLYRGLVVAIVSGTGAGQARRILSYVGSTKVATVATAWVTNPDNTSIYALLPTAGANVVAWDGTAVATPATAGIPDVNVKNFNNLTAVALPLVPTVAGRALDVSSGGEAGVDWANVGSPTTTLNLSGTTIKEVTDAATREALLATAANLATAQTAITDLSTRTPAALVGGRTDASVGAVAAGAITAAAIADAAIDRATFAQDALDLFAERRRNTATAGGASTITLDASASAVNDFYKNGMIVLVSGTGVGQFRTIASYVGSTKVVTVDRAWATNPDNTSIFELFASGGGGGTVDANIVSSTAGSIVRATFAQDALDLFGERRRNTATAGGASTITLDAAASAVDDFYKNAIMVIVSGTGVGQFRTIASYVGSTKVATVDHAWLTNPDNTSVFELFASGGSVDAASIAAAVWNAVRASYATAGTFGEGVNVLTIATAAANTVLDALLTFAHRSGRTFLGFIRRADAFVTNRTANLKGAAPTFYQPDNVTVEFSTTQDTTNGTRGNSPDVTNSETP